MPHITFTEGSGRPCPSMRIIAYRNGRVAPVPSLCGYWICERCRRERVADIVSHVEEMTAGAKVFIRELETKKEWEVVRKAATRGGANYLSMKRPGDATLMVAEKHLSGRGWETTPTPLAELGEVMLARPICRCHPCRKWKLPEHTKNPDVLGMQFFPMQRGAKVLVDMGYDPETGTVPGLSGFEIATRLLEASKG